MKKRKILEKILAGSKNVRFDDFLALIEAFGFVRSRVNGSHYLFNHPLVPRAFTVQEIKGKAKPYQMKQPLQLVALYNLKLDEDSEEEPDQNE